MLSVAANLAKPPARTSLEFWPVLVNVVDDGYDVVDMEVLLEANEKALRQGRPFVTIRDVRNLSQHANALQRKRLAQWQDENRERIANHCLGVATISNSPLVRGMMRAVFWMSPPPTREEVVATPEEAVALVFRWLSERDVARPPRCTPERVLTALALERL